MKKITRKLSLDTPINDPKQDIRSVQSLKKTRSLESLETTTHVKTNQTIEYKCNYKLSTEHISFLMEEERMKELQTIRKSTALSDYYQTFNSVFLIIYKTSSMILTYMYYNNTHQLNVDRLQVLNVLMGNFQDDWTQPKLKRIEVLSTNLYQMAKDEKDFERRVEYVARKLCNNKQKREMIQKAFLNERLKKFWGKLKNSTKNYEKHSFIHDMFETYSKKLCFYDIQSFIKRSLAQQYFKEKIEKYCSRQELDQDLGLDYTFEFLLLEEFSFGDEENGEEDEDAGESSCEIM